MASAVERHGIDARRRETHRRWCLSREPGNDDFIATHAHDDGGARLVPLMRIGSDEDGDIFVNGRGELMTYRVASLNLSRLDRAGLTELLVDVRRKRRDAERQRGTQEILFDVRGRRFRTNVSGSYLEVDDSIGGAPTPDSVSPSAVTAHQQWRPVKQWTLELTAAARRAGAGML